MRPVLSCMLSISGFKLTDFEKKMLEQSNPMGLTLFARNVQNKKQVADLCFEIKQVIGRADVLIAVDQEGGRVCRFIPPEFKPYVSQWSLASLPEIQAKEITRLHGVLISDDLRQMGLNWVYAPSIDVAFESTTMALKNRCFGENEKTVASLGQVLLETYKEQGICPCIKHAPGHGRATTDPHLNLPILSQGLKELEKDFYPFQKLAPIAPAMMTAHIVIAEIDDKPVTQSKKAIQEIIRGLFGYDGLLITDAIDMQALKGPAGQKAKASLEAGCDAVCYCFAKPNELIDVVSNCRPLTDKALERFEKIQRIIASTPVLTDIASDSVHYAQLAVQTRALGTDYDAVETLHEMQE